MNIEYWCPKEKKVVLTRLDMFRHPDLGMKSCFVCRDCGSMVVGIGKEEVKADAV